MNCPLCRSKTTTSICASCASSFVSCGIKPPNPDCSESELIDWLSKNYSVPSLTLKDKIKNSSAIRYIKNIFSDKENLIHVDEHIRFTRYILDRAKNTGYREGIYTAIRICETLALREHNSKIVRECFYKVQDELLHIINNKE